MVVVGWSIKMTNTSQMRGRVYSLPSFLAEGMVMNILDAGLDTGHDPACMHVTWTQIARSRSVPLIGPASLGLIAAGMHAC
jgi:hypothetical protein